MQEIQQQPQFICTDSYMSCEHTSYDKPIFTLHTDKMEMLEDKNAVFIRQFCQAYPDDDLTVLELDNNTIVEKTIVAAVVKKKRVRSLVVQPRDNIGKFAKRPRNSENNDEEAKQTKKQPNTEKYVAAGNFLLSVRYEIPDAQRNINSVPTFFFEEDSANFIKYLRGCMQCGVMGHQSLKNYVEQGKAIDFYFKIFSVKGAAKKKPSASELYKKLASDLQMPGVNEANVRWCQKRRSLAKISDLLQLNLYGYRCSPTEILKLASQIEKARKLKLVVF
jgi:hypothetical protein